MSLRIRRDGNWEDLEGLKWRSNGEWQEHSKGIPDYYVEDDTLGDSWDTWDGYHFVYLGTEDYVKIPYAARDNWGSAPILSYASLFANTNVKGVANEPDFNLELDDLSMYGMFMYFTGTELELKYLNTTDIYDMSEMFSLAYNIKHLDLSNFDTSSVVSMDGMFDRCYSLQSLDLSSFSFDSISSMYGMFSATIELEEVDISNLVFPSTNKFPDIGNMFADSAVQRVYVNSEVEKYVFENHSNPPPYTQFIIK